MSDVVASSGNFKTKVISASGSVSLAEAYALMQEKRIRHLPLTDESGDVYALLSKTDFIGQEKFAQMPAEIFATSPVETVSEDTPLHAVALRLLEKKISSVLVTNSQMEVIGIITTDDLIYQLAQILKARDESKATTSWSAWDALTTAGEFMRKLADIGI
jgi:CBS domain-containing protein